MITKFDTFAEYQSSATYNTNSCEFNGYGGTYTGIPTAGSTLNEGFFGNVTPVINVIYIRNTNTMYFTYNENNTPY